MKKDLVLFSVVSVLIPITACKASDNLPAPLIEYLENKNPSEQQGNKFYDDVTIWAEKDPEAATKWAYRLQKERGENDNTAVGAVLGVVRGVSKQGPQKTFRWIKTNFTDEKDRLNTICDLAVVEAFSGMPAIKIAEAGNSEFDKNSMENVYIAQNFFLKVPTDQENEVVKYGVSISDPQGLYKRAILGPTLENIAKKDFSRASLIWSSLENGNAKNLLFTTIFEEHLLGMNPEQIVSWLNSHEVSLIHRSSIESKMFEDWYVADKEKATLYFIERSKSCQPSEIFAFVSSIEKTSPNEAFELISKIYDQNTRINNLDIYAYRLYKNNLRKFDEIYKNNTNPEISLSLRKTLFNVYSSEDPKRACLYFEDLTKTEQESLKVFLWLSCTKWFEADSRNFMQWARALKKDEFQPIFAYLQATSKKFSSEENIKYISEEMPLGPKRDDAFDRIVDQMALKNAEEAITWAFTLKNENEKVQAIQKILLIWSVKDPASACDWITDNIKEYPDRLEPTFFGPFILLSNKDKKAALEKSKRIQSPKLRQLAITGLQLIK